MVPRSYTYSSSSSDSDSKMSRAVRNKTTPKKAVPLDSSYLKPRQLCSAPAATPSKPVVIPTRTQPPKSRRNQTKATGKENPSSDHNPNAIPPSMAALLAVTSIQHPRAFTSRRNGAGRRAAIERLSPDDFRYSLSSSSPKSWSILQSPPGDSECDRDRGTEAEVDQWSIDSDSTVAPLSSYRSLSSDSMPSLDDELDFESPGSPGPLTPAPRIGYQMRREKIYARVMTLTYDDDHPLSPPELIDAIPLTPLPTENNDPILGATPSPAPKRVLPFKSNLTASLRLLKSAAKTFAATTSPKIYSPDLISRSPQLSTVPTRPRLTHSGNGRFPAPILSSNIDDLPFFLSSPIPTAPATSSIQLATYTPSTLTSTATATAPPVFLPPANPPAEPEPKSKSTQRPREPRENSDFLRVVVLEMNMRRAGKLNNEEGRARIWLGPRADEKDAGEGAVIVERELNEDGDKGAKRSSKNVPRRWVGVLVD